MCESSSEVDQNGSKANRRKHRAGGVKGSATEQTGSKNGDDGEHSTEKRTQRLSVKKSLSLSDFIDPTKSWDLRDNLPDDSPIKNVFKVLPTHFKEGPWIPLASWTFFFIVCLVFYIAIDINTQYYASNNGNGIMQEFVGDTTYPAYTKRWYYNVTLFFGMLYVSWNIYSYHSSLAAWVSFTLCSWTIMTIRHGLCALAPFFPSVRVVTGMLRFPVLLSSSITFGVWNFVLMPVIALFFLKGEGRTEFLQFAFGWRMCQIHIFNILYAYLNCVWAEPNAQPLHLGDVNAAVVYIMTYIFFYYFVLDRIGIHLYPIFSPRTYMCIPSWVMVAVICVGNYRFWNNILEKSV